MNRRALSDNVALRYLIAASPINFTIARDAGAERRIGARREHFRTLSGTARQLGQRPAAHCTASSRWSRACRETYTIITWRMHALVDDKRPCFAGGGIMHATI